ncbi:MAG: hypothetical protein ABI367_00065 [Mucilaginibacter sp.]
MKKISLKLILVFAISLFGVANTYAQYVKSIPPAPKTTIPRRPSKYHVWISEEWILNAKKQYIYRPGFWSYPPSPKDVYKPGRWVKSAKGYTRVLGGWVTRK